MIYAKRCESTNRANTIILFRGYEISIAMDSRGRDEGALTRINLVVYKDDEDVTPDLVGKIKEVVIDRGIDYPTAEDLFDVMKAIEQVQPERDDEGKLIKPIVVEALTNPEP